MYNFQTLQQSSKVHLSIFWGFYTHMYVNNMPAYAVTADTSAQVCGCP